MKIKFYKNGGMRITAQNNHDSLSLFKFLDNSIGDNNPERQKYIARKEAELQDKQYPDEQFDKDCDTMGKHLD